MRLRTEKAIPSPKEKEEYIEGSFLNYSKGKLVDRSKKFINFPHADISGRNN